MSSGGSSRSSNVILNQISVRRKALNWPPSSSLFQSKQFEKFSCVCPESTRSKWELIDDRVDDRKISGRKTKPAATCLQIVFDKTKNEGKFLLYRMKYEV